MQAVNLLIILILLQTKINVVMNIELHYNKDKS